MSDAVVIIGAGQAGAQLAMSLRQGRFSGPIVLIGDEPHLPYQRPPLSKKFLSERKAPDTLFLRPENFWRDQDVTLVLGTPAAKVDQARRRIGLVDGREIDYTTLVFATGTSARAIPVPGAGLAGVYSLRGIADALRLRGGLDAATRIVIVGGGYIGLEVASVIRGEGRQVTIVEAQDRILKRVAGSAVASFYDRLHRDRGVEFVLGAQLMAIEGDERVSAVRLSHDRRLPADLVIVATGARANDDLAAAAGIRCDDGIVVDEFARAGSPGIYAVGDCSRFPSARYQRRLRLESVQNAIDQAKAAAASIVGTPQRYDPVPWFWSDQYESKLQIAGLADGYERDDMIGDAGGARFSVEYRKAERLIAVDAVNDARAHMLSRRRIAEETDAEAGARTTS
ncbi:MAG TPA: FAD-dependent oxidoreductase [Xanthobacteraceae bacterium]|nr:FAD-dependent oxidoreductase [Xanthobacteraceae bacterium]